MEPWEISRKGLMESDRRDELVELGFTVVSESEDTLQVLPPSPEWRKEDISDAEGIIESEIIDHKGDVRVRDVHGRLSRYLLISRD
ncbi:MAG: hypothetical protein ACC618_00020 [Patescibacteria group bacterium]